MTWFFIKFVKFVVFFNNLQCFQSWNVKTRHLCCNCWLSSDTPRLRTCSILFICITYERNAWWGKSFYRRSMLCISVSHWKVLKSAEEVGDLLNMRQSKLNPKKPFEETELLWTEQCSFIKQNDLIVQNCSKWILISTARYHSCVTTSDIFLHVPLLNSSVFLFHLLIFYRLQIVFLMTIVVLLPAK